MTEARYVKDYENALARYSGEALARFFALAGVTDDEMKALGTDFLGMAGAAYLSEIRSQEEASPRGAVLKDLARARRSSTDLAESLRRIMADPSVLRLIMDGALAKRSDLEGKYGPDSDTCRILSTIFPLKGDGSGFRVGGLEGTLDTLSEILAAIEDADVNRRRKGRIHALKQWCLIMMCFWQEACGELPRTGHYDREIGDYDSPSIAAFAWAAEQVDRNVTSRLLVKALQEALDEFFEDATRALLLFSAGVAAITGAGVARAGMGLLTRYLGVPPEVASCFWEAVADHDASGSSEKAILSKQEFVETLQRTPGADLLLQGLMALRKT